MTFENWWNDNREALSTISEKRLAKAAWDAATAAERQRCREIVDERGRYADIAGMLEQIGE